MKKFTMPNIRISKFEMENVCTTSGMGIDLNKADDQTVAGWNDNNTARFSYNNIKWEF